MEVVMARVCEMCGKKHFIGYSISHAHNKTKKRSLPNLQVIRIREGSRVRRATLCTRCIRTANFEKAI